MLKVANLTSGYGGIVAVKGVSLHVAAGEIVTLIGANGSGKSTLLNALAGMVRPTGGKVQYNERDITYLSAEKRVRQGISLVPEGRQLFAPMSVEDNLVLGAYAKRGADVATAMDCVFDTFPRLRERRDQLAGTLSGGEQQMVAIGRALMSDPRLLLLDEPSMGLAPKIAQEIFRNLLMLRSAETGILLVEQNANLALQVADRGYVIETGHIVLEGESDMLRNNQDVQRAYLGRGYQEAWEGER